MKNHKPDLIAVPLPVSRVQLEIGQKLWGKYNVTKITENECIAEYDGNLFHYHRTERPNGLYLVEPINGHQGVLGIWP